MMFITKSNTMYNNILFNLRTIPWMHETAARLYEAAEQLQNTVGQSAVARLLNESPQVVKNWETRGVSKAGAIKAQSVIGCSVTWLATGAGLMRPSGAVPAVVQPPTLGEALEVVARCLNDLPDSAREQAAQHLQTLARAPDSQKALAALIQAMAATDLSATPTAHHLLSAAASVESSALPRPALPKP